MSAAGYDVRIFRVSAYRAHNPVVHASVDGHLVMWTPRRGGWQCRYPGCDDIETCPHVTAVEAILSPTVLDGWDPQ
jgi:hypothetical protein